MTPFEHLAVLISIVLGLAIAQLLTTAHRLVLARARVRFYWLPVLWAVLLFITLVEWWWSIFALRTETTWNFVYFLFLLLSPVSLFLATASVLPEVEPERSYDLREYYYANRGWLFCLIAAGPVLDGVRRAFQAGSVTDLGAASNLVSAVLVGSLAIGRRPAHHAVITLAVAGLFLYFIGATALQLR
jgi:hypothetical protein